MVLVLVLEIPGTIRCHNSEFAPLELILTTAAVDWDLLRLWSEKVS
jgi:hypothetical protein